MIQTKNLKQKTNEKIRKKIQKLYIKNIKNKSKKQLKKKVPINGPKWSKIMKNGQNSQNGPKW